MPSCPDGDGETDKWLFTLNSRLEKDRADARCSMLVGAKRKSRFIGDTGYRNYLDPYFIQHPDTRIQYLFIGCAKAILKT